MSERYKVVKDRTKAELSQIDFDRYWGLMYGEYAKPDGSFADNVSKFPIAAIRIPMRRATQFARGFGSELNLDPSRSDSFCPFMTCTSLIVATNLAEALDFPQAQKSGLGDFNQALLALIAYGSAAELDAVTDIMVDLLDKGGLDPFLTPLQTGEDWDGKIVHLKLFVLATDLLLARRGTSFDWATSNIPADRFFVNVVAKGVTSDKTEDWSEWARALCDMHLDIVSLDLDDEPPGLGYEFDKLYFALWPVDIHAAMRVRRDLGLDAPAPEHPLMREPLAEIGNMICPDTPSERLPWYALFVEAITAKNARFHYLK